MCCWDEGPEPYENDLEEWETQRVFEDSVAEREESEPGLVGTLEVPSLELAEANRLLALDAQVQDSKRDAVLMTFTATFEDGYEVDLMVCNGDIGPWLDSVLFDSDGNEVQTLDGGDRLEGEYGFSGYTLHVKEAE